MALRWHCGSTTLSILLHLRIHPFGRMSEESRKNRSEESLNEAGSRKPEAGRRSPPICWRICSICDGLNDGVGRRCRTGRRRRRFAFVVFSFDALFQVHLSVAFLLVGSGELASAGVASEGFLARMRPYMRRQVVRPRKSPHANAALERFLSGVNADVAGEFITAGEASVASVDGTGVRTFVHRRLAGAGRVAPRLDRHQSHR